MSRGSIISFHGGCFVGGSVEWDKKQNNELTKLGFDVYQVNFPKTNKMFTLWARTFDFTKMQQPIFCIGRSSGGYLAKVFSSFHPTKIKRTIYICPVFNPLNRIKVYKQFSSKTKDFFGNTAPISTKSHNIEKELIMLAKNDRNVPLSCFTREQISGAKFLGPSTHTGMLTTTSKKFLDKVDMFFI